MKRNHVHEYCAYSDGLIEGSGNEEIFLGMELCTHDVVVMAGEDADALARLPVPNANRLVIAGRKNPRLLVMKLTGANVIEMSRKREQTLAQLVIVKFEFVVVATRTEERHRRMERDATHRSIMLVVLVDQRTHSVVPQLDAYDQSVSRYEYLPNPRQSVNPSPTTSELGLVEARVMLKCVQPLCSAARIHGRFGWNASPFTRLLLLSNLISISLIFLSFSEKNLLSSRC